MSEEKDILYHYCGVDAFVNILRTSSIWLSDVKKMNDSAEEKWMRDKIHTKLSKQIKSINEKAYKVWSEFSGYNSLKISYFYVCSFSEDGDDLTQWTRYADDGMGLAIGFSKEKLSELYDKFTLSFAKIIYDDEAQNEFMQNIIDDVMLRLKTKTVLNVACDFDNDYTMKFLQYKNPCFKSEKEWRLIHISRLSRKKDLCVGGFKFSPPEFRVKNNKVISYQSLDFSNIKRELIKEVRIGPSSKVTKSDVVDILSSYGYYGEDGYGYESPVRIIKSESTYRSN